jgi:hypothetical protein
MQFLQGSYMMIPNNLLASTFNSSPRRPLRPDAQQIPRSSMEIPSKTLEEHTRLAFDVSSSPRGLDRPEAQHTMRSAKDVPSKTLEEYEMENYQLKQTIDILARRLEQMDKVMEENQTLKRNIIQFRQEFRRQVSIPSYNRFFNLNC